MSRKDRPKPFLPLGGDGSSLLSLTCRRLAGLLDGEDRIFVVGQADHVGLIQQELPALAPGNFLAEPGNRGTAA
ncbi:MAG: mannose-1-phosphate guanylyltransferase, partial [Planctomycetes bacterium]|nr:mannose-1-phosphate guanylyltransferase [Planctomycetota bacterium]